MPLITEDLKFFEYKDIKLNQPIGYLNIEIYPALENLTLSYMKQEDLVEGMKLIHKVFDVSLTKSIPIDN